MNFYIDKRLKNHFRGQPLNVETGKTTLKRSEATKFDDKKSAVDVCDTLKLMSPEDHFSVRADLKHYSIKSN